MSDYWSIFVPNQGIVDVSPMLLGNVNEYYVNRVFVREQYRCTGIGTKMMRNLVAKADEMNAVLYIDPTENYGSNLDRLTNFFARFGFKTIDDPDRGKMRRLPK